MMMLVVLVAGCCTRPRASVCRSQIEFREVLFNPKGSDVPLSHPYDREWPVAVGLEQDSEIVFYRETVRDTQSTTPTRFQGPYRRFDSVRLGRGYR